MDQKCHSKLGSFSDILHDGGTLFATPSEEATMQQTPQEKKDDSVLEIGFTSGFFTLSTGFGENENEIGVEIKGCGSFSSVFASSLVSSGFGFTGLFSGMYMGSSMDRFTPLHIRAHNQPHLYEPPKGLYISKASFSSSSS